MLSTHQAQEVLGVRECIGKKPSPTSTKDKAKLEIASMKHCNCGKRLQGKEMGLLMIQSPHLVFDLSVVICS